MPRASSSKLPRVAPRGKAPGGITVRATVAKNNLGLLMKTARTEPVFIVRHGVPQAVVLGFESYQALLHKARQPSEKQLDLLRDEFDALHARMQTPRARKAVDALLDASTDDLQRALSKAQRRPKVRG